MVKNAGKMPAAHNAGGTPALHRLSPAVLIVATILSYLPVLQNEFVYDDHFQLERNPYIRDFRHLDILFTTDVWHFSPATKSNNYRPLHMVSYLLIYKIFGFNPVVYHATNLILFLASVLLLWKIFGHYVQPLPAFVGCILFATHPVHVEAVAWIGGITDLLCGMFLFLSFLFYLHNKNALSLLSFLFALFSKETSLAFPLIIGADHLLFRRQEKPKIISWCVGAAVLMVLYAALRFYALGNFLRMNQATNEVLSMMHAGIAFAGLYLQKMFFPVQLNAFYHFTLPLPLKVSWPGIVLLLAALIFLYAFRQNKSFVFGCIWFGVLLIPALFLKGVSPVLFAERYLYLPSAGFLLALVSLPLKGYVPTLLIAISVLLGGMTYSRNKIWRDDLTLWKDTVEKSPLSSTANYNLATAYKKQNNYQNASVYYQQAATLDPQKAESFYNLAYCQYMLGEMERSAHSLKMFLRYSNPNNPLRKDAEVKLQQLSK